MCREEAVKKQQNPIGFHKATLLIWREKLRKK
jgi:hypothetical protein